MQYASYSHVDGSKGLKFKDEQLFLMATAYLEICSINFSSRMKMFTAV